MENIYLNIELGISARKIISQLQIDNQTIEKQIEKGIELALQDIFKDENLIEAIRNSIDIEIRKIINEVTLSWELRQKIISLLENKLGKEIEIFSDKIAERLTDILKYDTGRN